MELRRMELMPGVFLNTLQTDKFKSDCLSVSLLTALDRETVSKNALIPRVLARGSVRHPDMDSINAACDALYGARLIPCVRKKGEILAVGFYAGFLPDRFTPDGSRLLEPVAALLGELLLEPDLRDGLLRRDYVESETEKLLDDIRARVNDKRAYAVFRLLECMCSCEAYGCDDMGSEADAAAVDYVDLSRYYRDLLRRAPIEIFYCGAADAERVGAALRDALSMLPRGEIDYEIGTDIRMNALEAQPRFFHETLDVTQAKLCLGFRLAECMEKPDIAASRVFNAAYGGSVTSCLFLNVRERLSLCYYASSACDSQKGLMLVSSGIESNRLEEAKAEILSQLEQMKDTVTEEELDAARRATASDLRALTDSPGALENFYLSQALRGLDCGPEELADRCEAVTAARVQEIARSVELDAVYFLDGEDMGSGPEDTEEEHADAEA
ncbi:MAG: insulinase family protein [Oscillospiraceae bacterium]|nr:insulinase family protein [Oscillospiraceae bacterium]